MSRKSQFQKYVDLTLKIRSLSSPLISGIEDDNAYRDTLVNNFRRIGKYAIDKGAILKEDIIPLLDSKRLLKKEELDDLRFLYAETFNAYRMETLDIPLSYRIANRILYDADRKGKEKDIIAALDRKVEISFAYMHMTQRLHPVDPTCYGFRDEGLEAAKRLLKYLPKEKFKNLPDEESKHIVLVNSRYISALFDRSDNYNQKSNLRDLRMMERALALGANPFYLKEAPNYNWRYHEFRTLQYITNFAESNNVRGFDDKSLEKIYQYTKRLEKLWHSDEDYFSQYTPAEMVKLYVGRISLLTNRISNHTYREQLYKIIRSGTEKTFDIHEGLINIFVMVEYLLVLSDKKLSAKEKDRLSYLYDRITGYIHKMPKKGSSSFMLSFLADILKNYREVQGGTEFEEICLRIMTAVHPPTYIHSLSVADIAKTLTKGLLNTEPERFIGFHGYKTVKEVLKNKDDILSFAYHSSLTHDIGKLFISEIVTTYGRGLFDEEFMMIKSHPSIAYEVLSKHGGTKEYINIAKYHHLFYDGTFGYPVDGDISKLPELAFIHIIQCADCLDAATDSVGRSYKKGKTVTQVVGELEEGRGTRYAPYVVDLFEDRNVLKEIKQNLLEGRDKNYRKAYTILSKKRHK